MSFFWLQVWETASGILHEITPAPVSEKTESPYCCSEFRQVPSHRGHLPVPSYQPGAPRANLTFQGSNCTPAAPVSTARADRDGESSGHVLLLWFSQLSSGPAPFQTGCFLETAHPWSSVPKCLLLQEHFTCDLLPVHQLDNSEWSVLISTPFWGHLSSMQHPWASHWQTPLKNPKPWIQSYSAVCYTGSHLRVPLVILNRLLTS